MKYFSIIITNYNYHKYLKECIISCLGQKTKVPYEVLLVDDGSSNKSISIIKKFKKNKKFKYYLLKNQGLEKAANFGILKSNAKYIVRVDADDFLSLNFLENIYQIIKNTRGYSFFYSDYFIIDTNNQIISEKKLPKFSKKEITNRGDFLATGTVYEKDIVIKLGMYNEEIKNCGLENYNLILRFIFSNYIGYKLNLKLFFFRHHDKSMSIKKAKRIKDVGVKILNKYGIKKYKINKNHPKFI